jgi:hypothetical protein
MVCIAAEAIVVSTLDGGQVSGRMNFDWQL